MGTSETTYTGYIEGYFGRILTWDQRYGILSHLHSLNMNTYLYGPKEDPFHRRLWKTPYPRAWKQRFNQFVQDAEEFSITVIPALAPGLSYDYCSESDYARLVKKFKTLLKSKVTHVALLMDDIVPALPENCKTKFASLGAAHGALLSRLLQDLRDGDPDIQVWFCPTVYSDQLVYGNAADSEYIKDLSAFIPPSVAVLWTGPHVVSRTLSCADIQSITGVFNGNVILWDNYYAIDYCPCRLFLGPYEGRDPEIGTCTRGLLINPTGLYNTDRFLLSLFSDFLRNKEATEQGWEHTARQFGIKQDFFPIRKFFWSPFLTFNRTELTPEIIERFWSMHVLD